MTRIGLVAAWLMAVGVATALAWQVVGAADDQVSDAPLTPVIAVSTSDPSPDTAPPATATTTAGTETSDTSTTTSTPTSTPSPSTTTTPSSTSSTATGIPATTTAVSDGGTVTVTGTDPLVELVAVVAAPGWSYEVIRNSDDRIEVRFEHTSGVEIRIRCEWEDGTLVADIDG